MRIFLVTPLLLLGACNVSTDANNDQVTLQYDENTAENVAADIGNTAENVGEAIANEAEQAADKVDNSGIVAGDGSEAGSTETANQQ